MATKQNLIDSVYWKVRKIKPKLQFNRKLVEQYMSRAWNQILHDAFRKDLTFLDFYARPYLNQAIAQDADTKQYYCILPEAIVQLPDRSEGVRNVSDATQNFSTPIGTGVKYVPLSEMAMRYKDNIDVGLSESTIIGYSVRYDRIWFDRNKTAGSVDLLLVIPFDAYTATDEIPVPSGKDEQMMELTMNFMLAGEVQQT